MIIFINNSILQGYVSQCDNLTDTTYKQSFEYREYSYEAFGNNSSFDGYYFNCDASHCACQHLGQH